MQPSDAASFYTGLVARLYRTLRSSAPDAETYARFVERAGQPALELGCGDGDPLLDLRARGLDVEGLDSSRDMLERCRAEAEARGLEVVLHHGAMQEMELPTRYRSMFLAGPTFNLLVDDDTSLRALRRMRAHLEPGGSALVPLFVPEPVAPDDIGRVREATDEHGALLRLTTLSSERDDERRLQTTVLRYEVVEPGGTVSASERPWSLHWHTQAGFWALAEDAGFEIAAVRGPDGGPVREDADQFAFLLRVPR